MFPTYQDIYDRRGNRYHEAMCRYPQARDPEFQALIDAADLPAGPLRVLDIPSSGGYLRHHLPSAIHLVCADPAESFLLRGRHEGVEHVVSARHDKLPFSDASFDAVLSLAGLHHLSNHDSVFREWRRILKPGGILCFGDARHGSPTARFLDEVVDRHNSMGHQGVYADPGIRAVLETIGFQVDRVEERTYTWNFPGAPAMLDFCRTLFGMDRNPPAATLLEDIQNTVGFSEMTETCHLNWSLLFVRATA